MNDTRAGGKHGLIRASIIIALQYFSQWLRFPLIIGATALFLLPALGAITPAFASKDFGAMPGIPVVASVTWYVNLVTCKSMGTGSFKVLKAPSHGTLSYSGDSLPLPSNECAGDSFPANVINYTWTASASSTARSDGFSLQYTSNDGKKTEEIDLVAHLNAPPQNLGAGFVSTQTAAPSSTPSFCPSCLVGDPINAATGNSFQAEVDFTGGVATGLSLTRYYNSDDSTSSAFGAGWHSTWHRGLSVASSSAVTVTRADGREDTFTKSASGAWVANPDVTSVLAAVMSGAKQTGWALTLADDSVETYTLAGLLTTIKTRAGQVTTLTYNSGAQLTKVTGPFGYAMGFTYNSGGNVATMTTPDGWVYSYAYDSNGNLISVNYPNSTVRKYVYENTSFPHALTGVIDENAIRYTTWTYDSAGRATSSQHVGVEQTTVTYTSDTASTVADPRGFLRTYNLTNQFGLLKPVALTGTAYPPLGGQAFTYDANGFIASRTDFDGNVTTYTHDARGDETSRVEAYGTAQARTITTAWLSTFHLPTQITEPNRTTVFTYDAHGNMLTKDITAGSVTRSFDYSYNASGQVLTATDPRGYVTKYAYDSKGDLTSITDALGHVTSITSYDGAGRPLTIKDANGVTTTLAYGPIGRLVSRTVGTLMTVYGYDGVGDLIRVTWPDSSVLLLTYDPAHRLTGIADNGGRMLYTLDAAGNRTREQINDTGGNEKQARSYTYDAVNRVSQIIGAQSQTANLTYDAQSNLTKVVDPLGVANSYTYDALNRLTQESDWNGGATISYKYDANDHLTGVVDPRTLSTGYVWNGLDEQTSLTSPDTGVTTRTFDAAGNVLTSTDARGKKTSFTYDALNRVTKALYADGTSATWQYDQGAYGIGRLSTLTDATGSTSFTYDEYGHVTQKKQLIGSLTLTTIYSYDAYGRLAGITYPSGKKLAYTFDFDGRISSIAVNGQTLVSGVTYFPFGAASSWTEGNGTTYQRSFDLDGRVTGLALPTKDAIALTYDADSRITGMTETGLVAKQFGYDVASRLTGYTYGTSVQTYGYDASSNRTAYSLNSKPEYSLAYAYGKASNRLLSIGGSSAESFTYDATGNMLTYGSNNSFAYDARGRRTVTYTGSVGTVDQINGLGQRVASQEPTGVAAFTNTFAYDEAGHLTGRYDAKGNLLDETVWLGAFPVAEFTPAGTFYIAPDHLGSPHQITNAANQQVWFWDHDPFGNGAATSTFTDNQRFPGQVYDASGFHYNYFRDYDPRIGRYIESDPIGLGGGVNTYAYVGGNPTSNVDPWGLVSFPIVGGPPGQWVENPSGNGQLRLYDMNGNAAVDFDYSHDHGYGCPHAHNWNGNIRDRGNAFSPLEQDNSLRAPLYSPDQLGGGGGGGVTRPSMYEPQHPIPIE